MSHGGSDTMCEEIEMQVTVNEHQIERMTEIKSSCEEIKTVLY